MKIIGLDSSGLVATVAIWEDGVLLAEESTNYKKTHSETLLPMLVRMREELELDLDSVDAIAVAAGPGSFTGLRIGAATAKGLGLVMEKPIIAVPTLEGLAYRIWGTSDLVCPIMDARRGQVYGGAYEVRAGADPGIPKALIPQSAYDMEELLAKLLELGRNVIFTGDGVPVFQDRIRERLEGKLPYAFAPAHLNRQSGGAVAALGAAYYRLEEERFDSGDRMDLHLVSADEFAPEYLRQSQAEREGARRFEI